MKNDSQEFSRLLRQSRLRVTPVRCALLKALAASEQPLSVDEIMSRLGKSRGKRQYDIVTIYRNMSAFVNAGIVGDVDLGTGKVLYEFKGEDRGHHHHVICEGCRKIEPLDVCGIEPHIRMLEKMGYKRLRHKLQFSGLCKACG